MPIVSIVSWTVSREVDVLHLEDHLETNVPEFPLEIDEDGIVITTLIIEPLLVGPLLWWMERSWITIDHWIPRNVREMDALIVIARRFQVHKCSIEKRYEEIDHSLEIPIH